MPSCRARYSLCGLFLSVALVCAEEAPLEPVPEFKKLPAISLLPHGSVLEGVMLPRYDGQRRLVSSLKTRVMTLVNDERVEGEGVVLESYHPDGSSRAKVNLARAVMDQKTGFLTATESVNLIAGRLTAAGTGIIYHLQSGRAFLTGPAETRIQAPTETTMRTLSPIRATAALGAALLTATAPLSAAPPAEVSAEQLVELQAAAASKSSEIEEKSAAAGETLAKDSADAEKASGAAGEFAKEAGIPVSDEAEGVSEAKPLEVENDPGGTLIQCDDGMYVDMEENVLVYRKNVRVTDPRFNLTGADELKIFFAKKPGAAEDASDGEESALGGFGSGFGDVERIIATGAVRIHQKAAKQGEDPVEASGGLFSYHVDTGEIILSERYPWVKKGGMYARAKEPNLTLRILKNGEIVTRGPWETGLPANLKR